MVWSARISATNKIGLIGMFCGGLITAVAGILRCTFVLLDRPDGPQLAGEWSCRESFIAVFVSNIPVMYPIFRRLYKTAKEATNSNSRSKTRSQSGGALNGDKSISGTGKNSYRLSNLSKPSRKKDKFKHPLSLPGETFYERFGSEEEIMGTIVESEQHKGPNATTKPSGEDITVTRNITITRE
jgi:hypothetical protein